MVFYLFGPLDSGYGHPARHEHDKITDLLTCYWAKQNRLLVQELVEAFSFNARRIARKLAHFVGVLNREDLNYHADSLREIAAKNRTIYRRLRKELEDLTNHGHYLMTR